METMNDSRILRLPLRFVHKGKRYEGEVVGKVKPFNKYFTIRIPGENMLILEATPCSEQKAYVWIMSCRHEFEYLAPYIGHEIEKHLV